MRLTIAKRDEIRVSATSEKFNDKIDDAIQAIKKHLEEIAAKTVPDWITKDMVDSRYIKVSVSTNLTGFDYQRCEMYKAIRHISLDNAYPTVSHAHTIKRSKKIESLVKKLLKLKKEKAEFGSKIRSVLNSFTTVKTLVENVPEFGKYFKDDNPCMAIVPIEQINELRKSLK